MQKIIAFSGYKNAGKDTAANIASNIIGNARIIAFADPIKKVCSEIFSMDYEMLLGRTAQDRLKREELDPFWSNYIEGLTGRKSLTLIGTDVLRENLLDDIWVLRAEKEIRENPDTNFIISDLRDPIEENMINRLKAENDKFDVTHINIKRGENPSWINMALDALGGCQTSLQYFNEMDIHRSEWCQVGLTPDHIIENNGSVEDLEKILRDIL